ncbi:MAG: hypothetical protein NZ908_00875, partial [Candidatus Micrarchaeota archaeon]|nr:hypothetical protein [Candidatus Micrarchaeota archaeon]
FSRKPEPEIIFRRINHVFLNSIPTPENYLRLLRLVTEDNKSVINNILSKITNMSTRDEYGDTALHILLKKGMVDVVNISKLYEYRLWEIRGKNGVMAIDLLLLNVFHGDSEKRQISIQILNKIIERKSIQDLDLIQNISRGLAEYYNRTKDPKILELILSIPKYYSVELVSDAVGILKKQALEDDLNLYFRLDDYYRYGKTRTLR